MSISFEMIGTLSIGKKTEKFNPYSETLYDSGWITKKLFFNANCGDSRHMLSINGGSFKDGHGDVYLFSKNEVDDNGNMKKGEKFTIPFAERLTSPKLNKVAEFKKFIIDLEVPGRRFLLEKASEKMKEGQPVSNDVLKKIGISEEDEVEKELLLSNEKRQEFITEWDFADAVKELIESENGKKKFKIKGEYNIQYSEEKKIFYTKYVPTRIYLANEEEEEKSTATLTLFYNSESFDDGSVEEEGKYYVNGYVFEYNKERNANIPCPYTIVLNKVLDSVDEKTKRAAELYLNLFKIDDESWKSLGVTVDLLNGAQKVEIDESMLTDFQQDMILLGELTLDDIRKEMGGSVYGDRVQENVFKKLAKGYSRGREDSVLTDEDFEIQPLESDSEDEIGDIFGDDDEI